MPSLQHVLVPIAALVLLVAACGNDDDAGDTAPVTAPEATQPDLVPAPQLDVDTLTATVAGTSVAVERALGETYVGAVTDDLLIAVSFPDVSSDGPAQAATVYLCDSAEIAEWLRGDVGSEPTTLHGDTLAVELSRGDSTVEGQVTFDDGSALPFSAELAEGDAGLYTAELDNLSTSPQELDLDAGVAEAPGEQSSPDHRIAGACRVPNCGWIIL